MSVPQQPPGQADRPGGAGEEVPSRPPRPAVPAAPPPLAGPASEPDVYRSRVALAVWWVWAAFALANLVDLAVQGHSHFGLVVAAVLLLITGVGFVTAFRPRVVADDESLMISNPLRDHQVPWNCVESLDLGDSLEVRCYWEDGRPRRKKLYAWAVHSPRRSRLKTELRARRKVGAAQRRSPSYARLPEEVQAAMTKTEAEHIVIALRARADQARAGQASAAGADGGGGEGGGRVVSRWDRLAIAVLLIPALALLVVALA